MKIYGQHDEKTIKQLQTCMDSGGSYGVLCADGHLGYAHPIGGVVAYKYKISLSGVGFDIACGNMAIKTDAKLSDVQNDIEKILDDIVANIAFGVGKCGKVRVDHALFDSEIWKLSYISQLKEMARQQLGSVGSGNHYVDIFKDESNCIWVGVHFGSRGLGHKITTHFLKEVGAKDGMEVPPAFVKAESDLGQFYQKCLELAGQYAYAGREYVTRFVVQQILKANILEEIHNHHNFAWKENHFGEDFWVVRKGATPAFPNQKGFVGGSMGDDAVIVEGVESEASKESLYSTVHGSGRTMGRNVAKKTLKIEEMAEWLKRKNVSLRGADLDESPMAYRRLNEVLREHEGTIKILHTLTPLGVVMAGKKDFDPYKD